MARTLPRDQEMAMREIGTARPWRTRWTAGTLPAAAPGENGTSAPPGSAPRPGILPAGRRKW